ncbi:MAG: hypothetical protein ACTHQ3_19285 [Motilibacteraceae bacterium]
MGRAVIALLAVGAVFFAGGALIRPRPAPDELRTQGVVAESWSGFSCGEPANLCTVEFCDLDGAVWRFRPPLSSARRRAVGTRVQVSYSPSDPAATARKTDGLDGYLHWVLMGIGAALAVCALFAG